jgi:hypothetical protein
MPRFYFHLRSEKGVSLDTDGIEFADIHVAYLDAFRAATDLWRELLLAREDPSTYRFEIADAADEILVVLPFVEVLEATRPPKRPLRWPQSFANTQATLERNSHLTDAIASEIRTAWNHLARSRVLLRGLEGPGARTGQT